jgi:hypothetical protein
MKHSKMVFHKANPVALHINPPSLCSSFPQGKRCFDALLTERKLGVFVTETLSLHTQAGDPARILPRAEAFMIKAFTSTVLLSAHPFHLQNTYLFHSRETWAQ